MEFHSLIRRESEEIPSAVDSALAFFLFDSSRVSARARLRCVGSFCRRDSLLLVSLLPASALSKLRSRSNHAARAATVVSPGGTAHELVKEAETNVDGNPTGTYNAIAWS